MNKETRIKLKDLINFESISVRINDDYIINVEMLTDELILTLSNKKPRQRYNELKKNASESFKSINSQCDKLDKRDITKICKALYGNEIETTED